MADYDLLYQDTYIDALLATANELKTAGYIYKGVATPSTNPGTPTERVAYLACEPGTYTNFGGIVIASGLYSLTYAGGTWTGTQMQAGSDIEVVQTTGQSTSAVMSQKAVTDSLVGSAISYDNSQGGLASENVQGAIDEVEQNAICEENISLELLSFGNGYLGNNDKWIVDNKIRTHYLIKVTDRDILSIKVTPRANSKICVAFLETYTTPSNNDLADVISKYIQITSVLDVSVPEGTQYIMIMGVSNNDNFTPSSVIARKKSIYADSLEDTVFTSVDFNSLDRKNGYPVTWDSNGYKYWKADGGTRKHYIIHLDTGVTKIRVTASSANARIAFFSQYSMPYAGAVAYFTSGMISVQANTTKIYNVPYDSQYLFVWAYDGTTTYTPTSLEIGKSSKFALQDSRGTINTLYYAMENVINAMYDIAWVVTGGENIINNIKKSIYGESSDFSILANYTQTRTIYNGGASSINDIISDLTVYKTFKNGNIVPTSNYTLTGEFVAGVSTFTVTCEGKTDTIDVTVTEYGNQTYYEIPSVAGAQDAYSAGGITYISVTGYETNSARRLGFLDYGTYPFKDNNGEFISGFYPLKVPAGCTSVKADILPNNQYVAIRLLFLDGDSYIANLPNEAALFTAYAVGSQTLDITQYANREDTYIMILCKYNSAGTNYGNYPCVKVSFL